MEKINVNESLNVNEPLNVGVEEIDEDQQRLVDLFNLLSQAVAKQDPSRYVDALFEELVRFSGSNLRHEERLIVRHDHDGRDNHKDEHHDMIDLLRDLQRRFHKARNQPAADNMKYRRSG